MLTIQSTEVEHAGFDVLFTKPPFEEWCELIRGLSATKAKVVTSNRYNTVRARYAISQLDTTEAVRAQVESVVKLIPTSYKFEWNIQLVWHLVVRFTRACKLVEQQNISQSLFHNIGRFPSWDRHDTSFLIVKTNTRPDRLFVEKVRIAVTD